MYRKYDALAVHRFDGDADSQVWCVSDTRRARKAASGAAKKSFDMICADT